MKTLVRLVVAILFVAPALAQQPIPAADKSAIDATLESFGTTLTDMNFDRFATLFTPDADFINIVGMHWHGKPEIVAAHKIVFTTRYKHVPQHTEDRTEALLAPGLVLCISTLKMDDFTLPDGKLMTNNLFRMTMLLEKHEGKWLIRSAQNTVIDAEAAKHQLEQTK